MSFEITGPGLYRAQGGYKIEITGPADPKSGGLYWAGIIHTTCGDKVQETWDVDGCYYRNKSNSGLNIIARWDDVSVPSRKVLLLTRKVA